VFHLVATRSGSAAALLEPVVAFLVRGKKVLLLPTSGCRERERIGRKRGFTGHVGRDRTQWLKTNTCDIRSLFRFNLMVVSVFPSILWNVSHMYLSFVYY